jgi:transcriptional regulator with XRE-family HTH domain
MTLEQVKAALSDRNLTEVARRTGLSYPTVQGIASGKTENPSYQSVERLAQYLAGASCNGSN